MREIAVQMAKNFDIDFDWLESTAKDFKGVV